MNGDIFFRQIKQGIDSQTQEKSPKPATVDELEPAPGEEPNMELKDYWRTLRYNIQEHLEGDKEHGQFIERVKTFNEMLSPSLLAEYHAIVSVFKQKSGVNDVHPQRELIDLEDQKLSEQIDLWVDHLCAELSEKSKEIGPEDFDGLRAECWMFFESMVSVMNTRSFVGDIESYYKNKRSKNSEPEKRKQEEEPGDLGKAELVKELVDRYGFSHSEVKILVDCIRVEQSGADKYSLKLLINTISRLWNEYNVGERKSAIGKISLGYLLSKGAESFAPSLFQNLIVGDQFRVAVFLQYYGLSKLSEIINAKTEVELLKLMNDINYQINERMVNSLFFQELEFIHEKSLGEIFNTLKKGKASTQRLLEETISRFTPSLAGIGMSLSFLAMINPVLGAIGLGGLPIMYKIAKKQNKKMWDIRNKERAEEENIDTQLGAVKSGFEEIKTSPETSQISENIGTQMNVKDDISLRRKVTDIKMRLVRKIPFDVSTVIASSVGAALQSMGVISGGAVLSNIIYTEQLNRPIQDLVNLYFNQFSMYIQDIQRMEEIFGQYEKLDLPEGEREKSRVSVEELSSFDISIKDLHYKQILRGIDLNIKSGDFVVIIGSSGGGKSTLLRNLAGLYKQDKGSITIGGINNDFIKKYGEESIYSIMSYCNQEPQIFEKMTLRENLLLWSRKEVPDSQIIEVLNDLKLSNLIASLDSEVTHLSGGEKVRIGLARTLIKGAKILLLDEPTSRLDSESSTEVRKVIKTLREKYPEITIVCVSHDKDLIEGAPIVVNIKDLQSK